MEISQEWKDSIEQSKQEILDWLDEVIEHIPKARNLNHAGRKHRFIRTISHIAGDTSPVVPILPTLIAFLENRYDIDYSDKLYLENAVNGNEPLLVIISKITELIGIMSKYTSDRINAPLLLEKEVVYQIEDCLCVIRDSISGEVNGEDGEDYDEDIDVKFLDSDLDQEEQEA